MYLHCLYLWQLLYLWPTSQNAKLDAKLVLMPLLRLRLLQMQLLLVPVLPVLLLLLLLLQELQMQLMRRCRPLVRQGRWWRITGRRWFGWGRSGAHGARGRARQRIDRLQRLP